jgi:hypothetical protein
MIESQLIMWAKEAGVFKLARVKIPSNYSSYFDLEHNVELGEQGISADSLNLVGSVYLGPLNIFEEREFPPRNLQLKSSCERYAEHVFGIIERIIRNAGDVAKKQEIPYFGVNIVRTDKNEEARFIENEKYENYHFDLDKKSKQDLFSLHDFFDSKPKQKEFVLHPTAQLYVPKK